MRELKQHFKTFLHNQHIADTVIPYLVFIALLIVAGIILFASVFLTKKILNSVVGRIFKKTRGKWDDLLIVHNLFSAIGYLVSVIVLKAAAPIRMVITTFQFHHGAIKSRPCWRESIQIIQFQFHHGAIKSRTIGSYRSRSTGVSIPSWCD